jgi:hypothetical protein
MILSNNNWELYAQARASGQTQRNAYLYAYPDAMNCKAATIDNKASALERNNDEIKARISEIKEASSQGAVMSCTEKREKLAEIARGKESSLMEKMKAIDLDNKMAGVYETKITGTMGIVKLEDLL